MYPSSSISGKAVATVSWAWSPTAWPADSTSQAPERLGEQPFKDPFNPGVSDWFPQSGQWLLEKGIYTNAAVQANSYTQLPVDIGPDLFPDTDLFVARAHVQSL